MPSADQTPQLDLSTLPPGVTTTFTWTCPFGCTVHVVDGAEQSHECVGDAVVRRGLRGSGRSETEIGTSAQRVVAELLPVLRDRLFDSWKDGVLAGRRGPCYGVDDDIPDGSAGEVPPTLAAVPGGEVITPDGHVDDVTCPCGPLVHPVAGLMHTLVADGVS